MSKTNEFSSINTNAELDSQHVQRVGDLISRAALFNALANVKTLEEAFAVIQGMPAAERYTEGEVEKMQELEAAEIQKAYELGREEGKTRWIPCAERLPDDCRIVLVTDWGETNYGKRHDGRWWDYDGNVLKDVSAWMPLPEPWKEEQ